jgi:signal transduction histidine kinase
VSGAAPDSAAAPPTVPRYGGGRSPAPPDPAPTGDADPIFAGSGEMRARCRAYDWSSTPLGPVSGWSQSLRTAVGIVLGSLNPMFLWWGPELVQIYNDAYRPSLGQGDRHPGALGALGREFWTDIWDAIGPQIEQVMTTGKPTWHVDQYLPIERNGRLEDVWWTYGYSPILDDDGSIGGTLVVCQETTLRVQADAGRERLLRDLEVERSRLSYAFQHAPTFLAVLRGPEHVFELVNDAYYQVVGHRELVGRAVFDALPEVRDQGFIELLDEVLATGKPFVGREVPLLVARTPGAPPEERFVDFVYLALVEGDGTRAGVIAHGSDVTEQVLARRDIERLLAGSERARTEAEAARAEAEAARAEAETANRAKSDFLAVMSHELRTPLNAIGGYAELLEMGIHGPMTAAQRGALDRIVQSQRHLLGLINEVLNYAKVEMGTVHFEIGLVPVGEAIADAASLVAPQARARRHALVIAECPPGMRVRADGEKVRQILVNLLSNAVKFTGDGGRVEVSCTASDEWITLSVADTGGGIPADKLETIFDPFVQVRSDLTRPHEGTGLGLAISRDLARAMGGNLAAASTVGEGSVFTLTLPAA